VILAMQQALEDAGYAKDSPSKSQVKGDLFIGRNGLGRVYTKDVATITVVIDPGPTETARALMALGNHGTMDDKFFHSSNLVSFPKRRNKNKDIHYGRNVSFATASALRDFLIAYDKTTSTL
jgi:hypothetical protein